MRLDDLYSYQAAEQLNEAPYGMLDKMKDKVMSKTPFADREGAKGRQQSGQKANELFKKFKGFAGQSGFKGSKTVPSKLVANFLSQNKLPNDGVDNEMDMTTQEVQQTLLKAVQNKVSGLGSSVAANDSKQMNPQHSEKPAKAEPQVNPEDSQQKKIDDVQAEVLGKEKPAQAAPTDTSIGLDARERKLALAQLKKL